MEKRFILTAKLVDSVRNRGKALLTLADQLESHKSDFGETIEIGDIEVEGARNGEQHERQPASSGRAVTAEQIKEAARGKAFRAVRLAKRLGVPVESLTSLLTKQNGFSQGKRHWFKSNA